MDPDLLGLRDADLTDAERRTRDRLLEDPEAAADHAFGQALGAALSQLPDAEGGPDASAILARARRPVTPAAPHRWPWVVPLLVAAAALLVVQPPRGPLRARGVGSAEGTVVLEAVAESPRGARAVTAGTPLAPDEAVVFRVTTSAAGAVSLREEFAGGSAVLLDGSLEAGTHHPGGGRPQAWTPDAAAPGPRRYVARWCHPDGSPCTSDSLTLSWPAR